MEEIKFLCCFEETIAFLGFFEGGGNHILGLQVIFLGCFEEETAFSGRNSYL